MLEEALDVRFGERGRGLVHDEDPGVDGERLGDLDALAVAHVQRAHLAVHVQVVDVQRGQDSRARVVHGPPVDDAEALAAPARGVAHEDVLGDGELGVEAELLVHRGDAGGLGLVRAVEADLLAVDADRAAVRLVDARDDLDERGLAGPVLADEGMDLTGGDREVDVLQRADTREGLGDAFQREQLCHALPVVLLWPLTADALTAAGERISPRLVPYQSRRRHVAFVCTSVSPGCPPPRARAAR